MDPCEEFVRSSVLAWWSGSSIENVDGVVSCEVPETDRGVAGNEVGSYLLHDAADSSLCDTIEKVDVWWAGGLRYGLGVKEFLVGKRGT